MIVAFLPLILSEMLKYYLKFHIKPTIVCNLIKKTIQMPQRVLYIYNYSK